MYVCMYVCMHACMCVCMCVCMRVCMYACMYVSEFCCRAIFSSYTYVCKQFNFGGFVVWLLHANYMNSGISNHLIGHSNKC